MSEHQNKGRKKKVGGKEEKLTSEKTSCSINTSPKSSFILYAACSGFHEQILPVGNGNTDFNLQGKTRVPDQIQHKCPHSAIFWLRDTLTVFSHCFQVSPFYPSQHPCFPIQSLPSVFSTPAEIMLFFCMKH